MLDATRLRGYAVTYNIIEPIDWCLQNLVQVG